MYVFYVRWTFLYVYVGGKGSPLNTKQISIHWRIEISFKICLVFAPFFSCAWVCGKQATRTHRTCIWHNNWLANRVHFYFNRSYVNVLQLLLAVSVCVSCLCPLCIKYWCHSTYRCEQRTLCDPFPLPQVHFSVCTHIHTHIYSIRTRFKCLPWNARKRWRAKEKL